tara:strand:- start:1618 stop:2424 length:807 start_codon:yes stop_codon:yes gene_type:complete
MSTLDITVYDQYSNEELLTRLDLKRLPRHVAVIMDGNGRWAKSRYMPRIAGHYEGMKSVREVVTVCREIGIQALTLYAFSQENWNRPPKEVGMLMKLMEGYLKSELDLLLEQDIRFMTIGRYDLLPKPILQWIDKVEAATRDCNKMVLTIAVSYGGRGEIVDAMQAILEDYQKGTVTIQDIDESLIERHLYTTSLPELDLLIRTSGEARISNFLLWQVAYAELHFTKTLWPDFRRRELLIALLDYQTRDRRFGRTLQLDRIQTSGKLS